MKKNIVLLIILSLALAAFLFFFGGQFLGPGRESQDNHECLQTGEESCAEPLIFDGQVPTPKPRSQSK
jgi:hypothetical protein